MALTFIAAMPFGRTMMKVWKTWHVISHAAQAPALRVRASFSQERMTYIPANDSSDGGAKVVYESKDGKTLKIFDALDWLAQLTTHIPNRDEQMVRYYGYFSKKSRGLRKKAGKDDEVPALIQSAVSSKEFRKNWARLIQKIYPALGLIHYYVPGVLEL